MGLKLMLHGINIWEKSHKICHMHEIMHAYMFQTRMAYICYKIMGPSVFRQLFALDTFETVNSAKYGNGQVLLLNTFSTFLLLNTEANRI